jgi:hypothetical protein
MPKPPKRATAQPSLGGAAGAVEPVNAALASHPLVSGATHRTPLTLPVSVAAFFVALALYLRTLHPTVAGGDAGELMAVAHELGTPHPPGYPTFAFTTKAAEVAIRTAVPAISVGMAQNAFHASLSAAAVACLCFAAARLCNNAGSGVLAAFLFGFAPNVWTYAVVTEVFPLNNFFMCALVLLVVEFWIADERAFAAAAGEDAERASRSRAASLKLRVRFSAFVCGLALTNQHTSVLFVVPVAAWVVLTNLTHYVADTPTLLLMWLLGMSPYLYLPLSSLLFPSTNSWGKLHEWQGFWDHFLRKEYGTFSLASKEATYRVSNFAKCWRFYVGDIGDQITVAGLAACVIGGLIVLYMAWIAFRVHLVAVNGSAASALKRMAMRPPVALVLLVLWALYCNFFNYLSNLPIDKPLFYGVQQRFWIQPLMILTTLCGVTFAAVTRAAGIRGVAAVALAAALAGAHVMNHFADRDESANHYVSDFGRSILRPLPPYSILLTKGDIQINSARFVQSVEGFRPDVRILDQELLTYPWYNERVAAAFPDVRLPGEAYFPYKAGRYDMKQFLDANRGAKVNISDPTAPGGVAVVKKRRVFVAIGWKEGDPTHQDKYTTVQFGSAVEVITKKEGERLKSSLHQRALRSKELAATLPDLSKHRLPPPGRYSNISWEHVVTGDFMGYVVHTAFELMSNGEALQAVAPDIATAVAARDPHECMSETATEVLDHAESAKTQKSVGTQRDDEWRLLCGLHLARRQMEECIGRFGGLLPTYVRRNLSVSLQTLMRLDSTDRARHRGYLVAMRDAVKLYLAEAGHELRPEEQANFKQVVDSLESQLA